MHRGHNKEEMTSPEMALLKLDSLGHEVSRCQTETTELNWLQAKVHSQISYCIYLILWPSHMVNTMIG